MSLESKSWNSCLQIASISDIGLRRTNNQDSYGLSLASDWADWQQTGHLLIVADGMGAHAAGELASKMAVDHVLHLYRKFSDKPPADALMAAIEEANQIIHRRGESNAAFHRMGTTCSSLLLLPQGAVVGQVGDSRVYRLRGNHLEQLSFDHSMAWEIRAATAGMDESSDLYAAIPKNVITRSLGPNEYVEVDIEGPFPFEAGDTFLVCSDGASGPIRNDEFSLILQSLEPDQAAQLIVDLSNLRGGPDNITAIVAKITDSKMAEDPHRGQQVTLEDTVTQVIHSSQRSIHWSIYTLLVLFALSALILLSIEHTLGAIIAGGASLLITAMMGIYKFSSEDEDTAPSGSKRTRKEKAPYEVTVCKASPEMIQNLRSIVSELRETSEENEWSIDWEPINQLADKAAQALNKNDLKQAAKHYLEVIGSIMSQIRINKSPDAAKPNDPSIDVN
ncbi:MAG: PP2C family protein-serine/threonine phosphatase [Pirellulales bacterium]